MTKIILSMFLVCFLYAEDNYNWINLEIFGKNILELNKPLLENKNGITPTSIEISQNKNIITGSTVLYIIDNEKDFTDFQAIISAKYKRIDDNLYKTGVINIIYDVSYDETDGKNTEYQVTLRYCYPIPGMDKVIDELMKQKD